MSKRYFVSYNWNSELKSGSGNSQITGELETIEDVKDACKLIGDSLAKELNVPSVRVIIMNFFPFTEPSAPPLTRELHDKIWEAATKRNEHKHTQYSDAFNFTLSEKTIPDKETFWKSLNL